MSTGWSGRLPGAASRLGKFTAHILYDQPCYGEASCNTFRRAQRRWARRATGCGGTAVAVSGSATSSGARIDSVAGPRTAAPRRAARAPPSSPASAAPRVSRRADERALLAALLDEDHVPGCAGSHSEPPRPPPCPPPATGDREHVRAGFAQEGARQRPGLATCLDRACHVEEVDMTCSALDSTIVRVESCLSQLVALRAPTARCGSNRRPVRLRFIGELPSLVALAAPPPQLA